MPSSVIENESLIRREVQHNFCAGPAALPDAVLAKAHEALLSWQGGPSILSISHRSSTFMALRDALIDNVRLLLSVPDHYDILLMPGGATQQFSCLPLNASLPGQTVAYVDSGFWARKAIAEAKRLRQVQVLSLSNLSFAPPLTPHLGEGETSETPHLGERETSEESLSSLTGREAAFSPDVVKALNVSPPPACGGRVRVGGTVALSDLAYLHYTANETVDGIQFHDIPDVPCPLVADMSSCIFSKPLDVSKFACIYASAQKNFGVPGCTLVIIRKDFGLNDIAVPRMMSYSAFRQADSMPNTPDCFSWFVADALLAWVVEQGGLASMAKKNRIKAETLYGAIDASQMYSNTIPHDLRSVMNVVFKLPNEETTALFVKEANAIGLLQLKGHRSVGGIRVSLYNAIEQVSVDALVEFMKDFEKQHG